MPASTEMSLKQFADALLAKGVALAKIDFSRELKVVAQLIKSDVLENFQGSHDPDGHAWLPLRRPRANSKGGDRPLLDTGLLRASVSAAGPGHVEAVGPTSLVIGSNLEYAGIHQHGGTISLPERRRGKGSKPWVFQAGGQTVFTKRIKATQIKIPQRQFLGIGKALEAKIEKVLAEKVAKLLGEF